MLHTVSALRGMRRPNWSMETLASAAEWGGGARVKSDRLRPSNSARSRCCTAPRACAPSRPTPYPLATWQKGCVADRNHRTLHAHFVHRQRKRMHCGLASSHISNRLWHNSSRLLPSCHVCGSARSGKILHPSAALCSTRGTVQRLKSRECSARMIEVRSNRSGGRAARQGALATVPEHIPAGEKEA